MNLEKYIKKDALGEHVQISVKDFKQIITEMDTLKKESGCDIKLLIDDNKILKTEIEKLKKIHNEFVSAMKDVNDSMNQTRFKVQKFIKAWW